MRRGYFRRLAARFAFYAGLLLMAFGSAFLFGAAEGGSQFSIFLSFICVVIGCFFTGLAVSLNKKGLYLFFAALFLMTGLYLFLSALRIIQAPVRQTWPLISIFVGLALLPAGWRRCGGFGIRFSVRFLVPAVVFGVLGCILLLSSFDIVDFSFSRFVRTWWPLFIVLGGLIAVLTALAAGRADDAQ
jgi:hypothetical protein